MPVASATMLAGLIGVGGQVGFTPWYATWCDDKYSPSTPKQTEI